MGPNSVTGESNQSPIVEPNFLTITKTIIITRSLGHSSVIFTSEAQINMIIKLVKPILAHPQISKPVYISVKKEAEAAFMVRLRSEMKKKVWEKPGQSQSWYMDKIKGICTTLCESSSLF
jgi:hypothetical protein